ncbi:MAG: site-specific integrase [bacterium]
MSLKYTKLTLDKMKKLNPSEYIIEHGIVFTRLKNGDGRYEVHFRANGQRIHRVVGRESEGFTRSEVEKYISKLKNDACMNRFNMPKGRKLALNFKQAANLYLEKSRQESGKNVERKKQQLDDYLIPFFNTKPVEQIKSFDVERYKKQHVEGGLSVATVNRQLAVFTHMMNKLVEWDVITHAPCRVRKYKEEEGRIVYLTIEQIQTLLEAARADQSQFVYVFIMIGLSTAMRRSEILSIELKNIDLKQRVIYIPKAKAGARVQPITDELAEFLERYIKTLKDDDIYLFPSKESKTGHFINIDKPYKRVVKAAGLDPKVVVRHTLRHTAITHLVQAGVDLPTVQRISGHKTLQMVMRYSHQNGEHIRAAMDKLENRYTVDNKVLNFTKQA